MKKIEPVSLEAVHTHTHTHTHTDSLKNDNKIVNIEDGFRSHVVRHDF